MSVAPSGWAGRDCILKQDIEHLLKSVEQSERAFEERKPALLRLYVELESADAQGLEEPQAAPPRWTIC